MRPAQFCSSVATNALRALEFTTLTAATMLLLGIVLAGVLSVSVWAAAQVWSRYPCKPWVTVVQKSPTRVSQSYMTEIGKFIIGWLVFIWVVLVLFGRCIDGLRSGFARTLMLVQMIDLYLDPFSTPR